MSDRLMLNPPFHGGSIFDLLYGQMIDCRSYTYLYACLIVLQLLLMLPRLA